MSKKQKNKIIIDTPNYAHKTIKFAPTEAQQHAIEQQQKLHAGIVVATVLTAGGRVLKDTFNFTDELIAEWQRLTAVVLLDELELAGSLARQQSNG